MRICGQSMNTNNNNTVSGRFDKHKNQKQNYWGKYSECIIREQFSYMLS